MLINFFKDKKITLMGLGLLGRGIGDAEFLAQQGAQVLVTDLKTKEQLATSLDRLKEYSNITYRLGEHHLDDFRHADLIIKAASVPIDSPYVTEARAHNIPITMSTALFVKLAGISTIGITGTRGKTTTTELIFQILRHAGKNVFLGGNVRGVSTLAHLAEVTPDEIAVLELDSWQLQGFGEEQISPQTAVFTTFMDDHLNYYKGDRKQYFLDKANIARYQRTGDVFITTTPIEKLFTQYGIHLPNSPHIISVEDVPEDWSIKLLGTHNRLNVACAIAVARTQGIDERTIREAVETFHGVPGRLEFLRTIDGVNYYNDTTATTPDATRVALQALRGKSPVVLIMGGADKTLTMDGLITELPSMVKTIVLLPGTGTDRIRDELIQTGITLCDVSTMQEAVDMAQSFAVSGDSILLSPAFASFGLFTNEFDRGDQFVACVDALI